MLTPEHFNIPLEKQLKMRIVYDEIDQCTDVKALQENLKATAEQLMKYQHLLSVTLRKQIENDLENFSGKIMKEVNEMLDGNSRKGQD